jgi:hypothetical protein
VGDWGKRRRSSKAYRLEFRPIHPIILSPTYLFKGMAFPPKTRNELLDQPLDLDGCGVSIK